MKTTTTMRLRVQLIEMADGEGLCSPRRPLVTPTRRAVDPEMTTRAGHTVLAEMTTTDDGK
jgi:hypothetical protein